MVLVFVGLFCAANAKGEEMGWIVEVDLKAISLIISKCEILSLSFPY